MESSLQDLDSYWNDPIMSILMQPSHEAPPTPMALSYAYHNNDNKQGQASALPLIQRLSMLHEKLREYVADNAQSAQTVQEWAQQVALEFKDVTTAAVDNNDAITSMHVPI